MLAERLPTFEELKGWNRFSARETLKKRRPIWSSETYEDDEKIHLKITSSDRFCEQTREGVSSDDVLNWFGIESIENLQMALIDDAVENYQCYVVQECTDL